MRGVEQIPWLYDAMCAAIEWRGLGRWRARLAGGAKGRVLDLGCGTGRNLPLFRDVVAIGLEPSREAITRARSRSPGTPLLRGSAEALPFRDASFDTVVCGLVLCSVPSQERALAEIRRVLRPGGEVRLLEHVRSEGAIGGRIQDALQPAWTIVAGGCHPNRRTEYAVKQAGFEIVEDGRRARGNMRLFTALRRG